MEAMVLALCTLHHAANSCLDLDWGTVRGAKDDIASTPCDCILWWLTLENILPHLFIMPNFHTERQLQGDPGSPLLMQGDPGNKATKCIHAGLMVKLLVRVLKAFDDYTSSIG